jgi:uncharacterized membrane protein YeaQ/YmgE (transglycosylase-associated protein family)
MSVASLVLAATMNPGGIIAWLIIGLVAGALAGFLVKGSGFGIIGDIIVGLIGAFVGGLLMNLLVPDANTGFWGSLIVALIGACILIFILRLFSRGRGRTV